MAYRSKIVIAVKDSLFESNINMLAPLISDSDKITKSGGIYHIRWEAVKWYEDYPDVIAIEAFLHEHPNETAFYRIGEEHGDVEISENGEFDSGVYINPSIFVPEGERVVINGIIQVGALPDTAPGVIR